jgi:tRNA threonylcarbamoyl adenosine modification protein YjeE
MGSAQSFLIHSERELNKLVRQLAKKLQAGQVVLLSGPLGSGKTTLVRSLLRAYGYHGAVRSPTFNLIQVFDISPPLMHADLYRVQSYEGIGLEEYLDTHLCLIEWPERATGLIPPEEAWQVHIDFHEKGRLLTITPPASTNLTQN